MIIYVYIHHFLGAVLFLQAREHEGPAQYLGTLAVRRTAQSSAVVPGICWSHSLYIHIYIGTYIHKEHVAFI